MAKQLNSYEVKLAFTADTKAAKAQLQDLQNQLTNISTGTSFSAKGLPITNEIQKGMDAAAQLKVLLEDATNVNTGKLDLTKFESSLRTGQISLKDLAGDLKAIGPEGTKAFSELAIAVNNAETPIISMNAHMQEFFTTLKNTARWQISSSILHGFMGALQSAYGYAQNLNESLNNIRIVTGYSSDQMADFAREANNAAKALSTTTTEYTNASLIYFQQGLDDEAVKARTDVTVRMAQVTGQGVETVSNQLTAIWNNFAEGSENLEYYADVITALGAATASSSEEISTGLNKFAAAAKTVGLSYEYATAALATVTATTRQSADTVGTAFRTLFSRLEGLKLGKTLEDGVDLNKYSQALADVGVNILDQKNQIKDMDTILQELAGRWKELKEEQQIALATTVGGVRQYTTLMALLNNWDFMEDNLKVAREASGTLAEQAQIYAESWEAAQKRVRAALEGIYQQLIDDKFFIRLNDLFADILNNVNKLVSNLGGLKGVLVVVSNLLLRAFGNNLTNSFNAINTFLTGTAVNAKQQIQDALSVFENSNFKMHLQQRLELQQQLVEKSELLTEAEKKTYAIQLDRLKVAQETAEAYEAQAENLENNLTYGRVGRAFSTGSLGSKQISGEDKNRFAELSANLEEQSRNQVLVSSFKSGTYKNAGDLANAARQLVQKAGVETNEKLMSFIRGLEQNPEALIDENSNRFQGFLNNLDEILIGDYDSSNFEEKLREFLAEKKRFTTKEIEDFIEDTKKLGEAKGQQFLSENNAQQIVESFSEKLSNAVANFGQVATKAMQGVSQLSSGLLMLKSSFETLKEASEEGSVSLTTLVTVLPSLSMGVTSLVSGIGSLAGVLSIGLGPMMGIVAALTTVIVLLDRSINANKYALSAMDKANKKYDEQKTKVEELSKRIEELTEKQKELSALKEPTLVEQGELTKVKALIESLKEQQKIEEKIAEQEKKKAADTFFNNLKNVKYSSYQDLAEVNSYTEGMDEGPTSGVVHQTEDKQKHIYEGLKQLNSVQEQFLNNYDALTKEQIQSTVEYLTEERRKISKNAETDYEKTYLEPLLKSQEFLNAGLYEGHAIITSELEDLLNKSGVTIEEFSNYIQQSGEKVKETVEEATKEIPQESVSSIAKRFGLDEEEIQDYAFYLQNIADGAHGVATSLSKQDEAAKNVAIGHIRLNKGLEALSSNYESWFEILRSGKVTTREYHGALKEVRSATADLLDLNLNSLSANFFDVNSGNLELLEEAAEGSTEAIEKLRRAAANDILLKVKSNPELNKEVLDEIDSLVAQIQNVLQNTDLTIGEINTSGFINSCNELIKTSKMTAEQATDYFKALGYDVKLHYVEGDAVPIAEDYTEGSYWDGTQLQPIPKEAKATTYRKSWIPAIESITYRGSAGGSVDFTKSALGGAGKKSGGGGSSKKEVKTVKNFEDEIDRYHKINAEIANQERLLTNLGKAKDRAYGKDKVAAIQAEFDALGRSSELLSEKLEEAQGYRATDAARLSMFGGVIDENGVISNYKEMYAAQWQAIRDAYATYNASVQDEAAKAALESAEEHYEAFKDAISKFEGSQEQVEDLIDAIADNYYERLSKKIEEINAAVEVRVTIDEDSLKKVQHALAMTDDFAFFGIERVGMLQTELDPLLDKMDVTRRQIVDLVRQGQMTEFTDEIIDSIRDAQGNLMDYEEQLKELNATLREEFPKAVDEATEAIDNFGSTFKHYSSVLDHYKDLLDLTGRSQRDFGLNMRLAAAQTKVASDATSAAVANYKLLLQSQEETQKLLDNAIASGDRDEMSYWKKQLDEVTQKVQSAKEDILTAWKETLQAAANEYEVTVNQTITKLERQIAPFLSLDAFADAYKKSKDILDEYVTSNEQIYQLNKLVRQVEDVLSKSTSDAAAAKMNELKNEIDARKQILDIEGESHNLSEYDIEYLQKKYQLTLAQMQLEDAQDAKTTMRLSRDASGNYSYIYTANQDNIDQAAQNYEDKLRELEKLSEDYIEQLSDQIISNYQAMTKELSSVRAEDFDSEEDYQKKLDEIRAYYLERDNYFKSEMRKALNDLGTTYNDVTFGIIENHGDLETSHFDLAENTARANEEMEDAWVHWKNTTDEVKDEFHDIVGDINEDIGSVEDKSDELKDKIENEVYPILRDFLKNTATDVQSWQETYVRSINNAIQANHEFLDSIEALKNTSFSADEGFGIAEPIVQEMGVVADVSTAMANVGNETLAEAGKSGNGGGGEIPRTSPDNDGNGGGSTGKYNANYLGAAAAAKLYKNQETWSAVINDLTNKEAIKMNNRPERDWQTKIENYNITYNDQSTKLDANDIDSSTQSLEWINNG